MAFSLGGWICRQPGGLLVNVFTRTDYTVTEVATGVDAVSALRAREDMAFASRAMLECLSLGLEEPMLRGRGWRDISGMDEDAGALRGPLTALLDSRVDDGTLVFCPAAIGGHVNHLATRLVTWEWATSRGRQRQLRFYEDLPYASWRRSRQRGVADLWALVGGSLRRRAWRVGDEKGELVRLYPSQLNSGVMRRLSPAALWPIGRHEAFWEVIATS